MNRKLSFTAALLLVAVFFEPALAQRTPDANYARPVVRVEMSKGRMIRLPAPATGVFIGDSKIADVEVKSPTTVYLIGKGPGETTLMAVDLHDRLLADFDVVVGLDAAQLRADLKRLIPGSDIDVSSTGNALVLTGVVATAADAEMAKTIALRFVPDKDQLINTLRVDAPNQINLRVRVVEVSRDIIKAIGVNWQGAAKAGDFAFGLATGQGGVATNLPNLQGLNTVMAGFHNGSVDLNAVIDALDSQGLITILAEPNLTAVSGAPANFLAGGEFPIPIPQSASSNGGPSVITVEFKKYGVSLGFVATITDGNRINLLVKPEVSQLTTFGAINVGNINIPALTTRRAETTVDLASGQSFAIAGLMQNNVNHQIQKFPGIGNLPVLGALFRSDRYERGESELVVIVTPYIVRPASGHLAVPTDGYAPPTDIERLLEGSDAGPSATASARTPVRPNASHPPKGAPR